MRNRTPTPERATRPRALVFACGVALALAAVAATPALAVDAAEDPWRGLNERVHAFNEAVKQDVPFNPNVKDGRCTEGLAINQTHWANTLDDPPFEAYAVTCGITFTYGGLRVSTKSEVLRETGEPIPGLFACGELVGDLFFEGYPGGSGLTAGAVFGRQAGISAAKGL